MKTLRKIKIVDLEKPDLSQSRIKSDPETIASYKATWESNEANFPPIVVYTVGYPESGVTKYHIADGFHRVQALMMARLDLAVEKRTIACEIRSGTIEDAIAYSLSANLDHGLRPSTADKKRAILLYYGLNPINCSHSNNQVGKACGCSHTFVGAWKQTVTSTPAYIISVETKIPTPILEQTIANLIAAQADGKIVTIRNGKELIQSEKVSPKALQPSSIDLPPTPQVQITKSAPEKNLIAPTQFSPKTPQVSARTYIVKTTASAIPRGTVIEGFESLTNSGNIAIDYETGTELISSDDAIAIPYPIDSQVCPIDQPTKELTVTGYALVAADLKIKSIDKYGFAVTHSSTMLQPFIKKDDEEIFPPPILDLSILSTKQLHELIAVIGTEIHRRTTLPQDTPNLTIS